MKRLFRFRLLAVVLLLLPLLSACDEGGTDHGDGPQVTVMTRNLYVGAEITRLLLVTDPAMVPIEVMNLWADVQSTDFSERAEALADEIEAVVPDIIGLQEVSLFRYQTPGDAALGGTTPAATEVLDFLDELMAELSARGLNYTEAARTTDFDIELPIAAPPSPLPDDIRLTDHEVILVNNTVNISDTDGGNFEYNLIADSVVGSIEVTRGWVSIDADVDGEPFRFVSAHLEPATLSGVIVPDLVQLQHAQAAELNGLLSASTLPLIVVGDFNSPVDGSHTGTYAGFLALGLEDVWTVANPAEAGFTCCQAELLDNTTSELDIRIDVILFGNQFIGEAAGIVGEVPADRTPSGLWPSDHAGVWGTVVFK